MIKVIALDYGKSKTGVAISDDNGKVAKILPFIQTKKTDLLIKQVSELIDEHEAEHLLIGLPVGLKVKPTAMSREVQDFAEELHEATSIPYSLWNETGTSKQAAAKYRRGRKSANKIHSEAARIMLQEYLDFLNTGI